MYQQDFKNSEAGISERIAALAARESRYIGRVPTSSGVRGKDEDHRFSPLSVIDIDSASSFEIGNESRTLVCDWMYRVSFSCFPSYQGILINSYLIHDPLVLGYLPLNSNYAL